MRIQGEKRIAGTLRLRHETVILTNLAHAFVIVLYVLLSIQSCVCVYVLNALDGA